MWRKATDQVRALAQILAAFGQIVMSLVPEVQQRTRCIARTGVSGREGCAKRSPWRVGFS